MRGAAADRATGDGIFREATGEVREFTSRADVQREAKPSGDGIK